MATEQAERVDLRGDGRIILYKREGLKRPKWQVRIRVPNSTGYKIVTTGTDVLRDAERFAENLYEELYMRVKAGGSVQSRTFKQVYEEWKKHVTTMGHTRRGGSGGCPFPVLSLILTEPVVEIVSYAAPPHVWQ